MNIIVLNSNNLPITGGQVYDSLLYKTIQENSFHRIEFCEERSYPNGFNFLKLICPFLELTLLKKIKNKDICFWGSSVAYRHLLLLLIVRIFFPRIKVHIIHHHYQYEVEVGIKKKIYKLLELSFLNLSSSIIIPSPYILSRTKELLPKKKINYIEIPFKENEEFSINKHKRHGELLYIGTIEHRKGLHLLLDSLFLLKKENYQFSINLFGKIVDNDYYLKLLDKVALYGLGKEVVFHGRVSSETLKKALKTAELFVLPSLLEGYGMVLMEAMSYGIPVIAFNNSAMPFTIKDGFNGFLAKNNDPEDFKILIQKVITNPKLRDHLSRGALMTFKNSRKEYDFIKDIKKFLSTL